MFSLSNLSHTCHYCFHYLYSAPGKGVVLRIIQSSLIDLWPTEHFKLLVRIFFSQLVSDVIISYHMYGSLAGIVLVVVITQKSNKP